MADTVKIRLEGGPCDGRNATARVADFGPVGVKCGGVDYQPTARTTAGGRLIYTTKASQQPKPPPGAGPVARPNKAHRAWHNMLHEVFVDVPKELHGSARARRAIRRLRHRRGLK